MSEEKKIQHPFFLNLVNSSATLLENISDSHYQRNHFLCCIITVFTAMRVYKSYFSAVSESLGAFVLMKTCLESVQKNWWLQRWLCKGVYVYKSRQTFPAESTPRSASSRICSAASWVEWMNVPLKTWSILAEALLAFAISLSGQLSGQTVAAAIKVQVFCPRRTLIRGSTWL